VRAVVSDALQYAVQGVPMGCVFALLAIGLVLNYKTSGVFNLAFAAQAYASAAVFFVVRKEHQWALAPAVLLAVVVLGVVVAVVLDRGIYRHQRAATPLAKLVTSLGLLVAIPQIVLLFIGTQSKVNPPPLWPAGRTDDVLWPEGSRYVLDAGQIATLISTGTIVVGLGILFARSAAGLRMRAVVESPRLLELQGVDAQRVALGSWILSSLLASLAGVLLAPLFAQLNSQDFFTLLTAALAACVIANLTSITWALVGGLGLGVLQAELAGFMPTDSVLTTGLRPSLPFVVLFVLLLARRSVRGRRAATDPLAGVDPPRVPPVGDRPRWMTVSIYTAAGVALAAGLAVCAWVLDDFWLGLVAAGACLSVILLSIVLTTGIGGTISLCQGTFAAIGAFTTAQLVQHDVPVMIGMLAGAVVAAAVGAALGLPVIRLPGIYAALATLAFALMFQAVLLPLGWVSGGNTPLRVPRPVILGARLTGDMGYLLLATLCLAVLGLAVALVRQGTTGRFLDAVRGSSDAAAAVGINATRHQLVVFVAGAAVAGFGGGLLASYVGEANYNANFAFFFSLVWVVLVVTAGARKVQAAVLGGLSFFLVPQLLEELLAWPRNYLGSHPATSGWQRSALDWFDPRWAAGVAFVLFGLGALTYARHPEGVIEAQSSAIIGRVNRIGQRGRRGRGTDAGPTDTSEPLPSASRSPVEPVG
jgi:branched-subunit amino acid ABC-type transport system permease component